MGKKYSLSCNAWDVTQKSQTDIEVGYSRGCQGQMFLEYHLMCVWMCTGSCFWVDTGWGPKVTNWALHGLQQRLDEPDVIQMSIMFHVFCLWFVSSFVSWIECKTTPVLSQTQTGPWYWYQEDNPGFQFLKSGFISVFHQLSARFHPSPLSSSWYTYRRLWGIHSPAPLPPHWNEVYEWGGRGGEEGKCEDRKRKKRKDWRKEGNRGTR